MSLQKQNSEQYFRALTILHTALLGGQIIIAGVFIFMNLNPGENSEPSSQSTYTYVLPMLVVVGAYMGQRFYDSMIENIRKVKDLKSKMEKYRSAFVVRMGILEALSLISLVIYYISNNILFLGVAGSIILYFMLIKPSAEKASTELQLNTDERSRINDPDEIIAEVES